VRGRTAGGSSEGLGVAALSGWQRFLLWRWAARRGRDARPRSWRYVVVVTLYQHPSVRARPTSGPCLSTPGSTCAYAR